MREVLGGRGWQTQKKVNRSGMKIRVWETTMVTYIYVVRCTNMTGNEH
jgi:hypothetical protein